MSTPGGEGTYRPSLLSCIEGELDGDLHLFEGFFFGQDNIRSIYIDLI